ncbi:MAG: DUF1566 domain-containing protein [bacterium]|nr:DUF1566 domain-containing protein [bacterium]
MNSIPSGIRYWLLAAAGLAIIAILLPVAGCSAREEPIDGVATLRAQGKTLTADEARDMVKANGFFDRRWNKFRSFPNKFELKVIAGQKIVVDHATGLAWHQSGSTTDMGYHEAERWVKSLNVKGYAGYKTWRLPTLAEAASLMESKREKQRYIDPLFSGFQHSIRTSDIYSDVRSWSVSFHSGRIFKVGVSEPDYVRPVTTYDSSKQ